MHRFLALQSAMNKDIIVVAVLTRVFKPIVRPSLRALKIDSLTIAFSNFLISSPFLIFI